MKLGGSLAGKKPLNIAEVFQSLLDDTLLGLVELRRVIAHQSLHHELEELFQTFELRTIPLFHGIAEFRGKLHLTSALGH
jgi:hypothetical protein